MEAAAMNTEAAAMDAGIDAIDLDIDMELLLRCFEARRESARPLIQTDDWCRAAMAPELPLCSCCASLT
jgi:hypothetical protein